MNNATHLNLISYVHPITGTSVGMWRNVLACPIEWRVFYDTGTERTDTHPKGK